MTTEPAPIESDQEMADKTANTTPSDDDLQPPPGDNSTTTDDDDISDIMPMEDNGADGTKEKPKDPSTALISALEQKESGNTHFSSNSLTEANRCYRKGISLLKPFNMANSGDEQIQSLLITLNTNLSMVCYKQQKYKLAKDAASKALEIDASNVKALYRRALALRSLGDEEDAISDLKTAYKIDPNNSAVKKEMASIRKSREISKRNEKERLQKAFSSGSLLYGDKEEEERKAAKRREKEEKERKEREEKEKQQRKQEWEDDCVQRLKEHQTVLSFEEWEEQRVAKIKEEKEREEQQRKEEARKKREERKAKANNTQDSDDEDDELTEKELAMLRGYKKTSDGRTTSYFTREQTEKEKELIGCIMPKRLESSSTNSGVSEQQQQSSVGSAWNAAGTTWEEKDTTDWCKTCLKECLLDSMAVHTSESGSVYIAQVKGVDSLSGDASVALAGGKKRYIYDFHTNVKYEILNDESVVAKGMFELPDVNSAHTAEEELEVDVLKWVEAPDGEDVGDVENCRGLLVGEVRKSVLKFVERFNANF